MSFVDAIGTVHAAATGEVRIVSLVPSITELLCDLGLADRIVARTGFCIHPREQLRSIPKVGGTKDVDLPKLRELAPTHVILNIDENRRETGAALAEFIPHRIVTHPNAPEDNLALYQLLGGLFGREAGAAELATALTDRLETLAAAQGLPRRQVLYLIWRDPWMTVSPDTYIARMLALVNWHTVPRQTDSRYPAIQLEALDESPDMVLLSTEPYPFRDKHIAEIRDCVRGHPDIRLIAGDMVSWYGSRAIAGVAYMQALATELAGGRAA
jgi:ABC-type Fe3+-hydroxamate transport system substrate-binding protein